MSQLVVDTRAVDPETTPVIELPLPGRASLKRRRPARSAHLDRTPDPCPDPANMLRRECEGIARTLASTTDLLERIDLYKEVGIPKLARAAALCPDLMPILNGEFEWIALTMADID
jgi:hypothetical protein